VCGRSLIASGLKRSPPSCHEWRRLAALLRAHHPGQQDRQQL
jgi:hypothetical protein